MKTVWVTALCGWCYISLNRNPANNIANTKRKLWLLTFEFEVWNSPGRRIFFHPHLYNQPSNTSLAPRRHNKLIIPLFNGLTACSWDTGGITSKPHHIRDLFSSQLLNMFDVQYVVVFCRLKSFETAPLCFEINSRHENWNNFWFSRKRD